MSQHWMTRLYKHWIWHLLVVCWRNSLIMPRRLTFILRRMFTWKKEVCFISDRGRHFSCLRNCLLCPQLYNKTIFTIFIRSFILEIAQTIDHLTCRFPVFNPTHPRGKSNKDGKTCRNLSLHKEQVYQMKSGQNSNIVFQSQNNTN